MRHELRTPLCQELGIQYPIFSVGFGDGARAELVAAVSGAGGFGVLGAAAMNPDEITRRIVSVRRLMAFPFGVNVIIQDEDAEDLAFTRDEVAAVVAQDVAVVVLFYNELYDTWWPGAPHRTLRNKTFAEWDAAGRPPPGGRPGEGTIIGKRSTPSGQVQDWPRYACGAIPPDFEGDFERVPMFAGESCSVVNDIKPAAEIVWDIVGEAEAALAGVPE